MTTSNSCCIMMFNLVTTTAADSSNGGMVTDFLGVCLDFPMRNDNEHLRCYLQHEDTLQLRNHAERRLKRCVVAVTQRHQSLSIESIDRR